VKTFGESRIKERLGDSCTSDTTDVATTFEWQAEPLGSRERADRSGDPGGIPAANASSAMV
jgi:hypothetical protein